ncbi:hypothetical protein [Photorhabdus luminescens]|uniref:Uncharacterized protein n=1 Tax=Photorhabdus luminescens subsp. mexicana TaxID=2100167 RepID=A0A4R4IXG5_PHOLU|nr:hypothetical protein [Photorhabdus luminescens]TDB45321.1 hypothetical protein C5468_21325 [Photorhabdus luminescens subsp. mexicana]
MTDQRAIVHGNLIIYRYSLGQLNVDKLPIKGSLCLSTGITTLPSSLVVSEDLFISYSSVETLPDGLLLSGVLNVENTPLLLSCLKVFV